MTEIKQDIGIITLILVCLFITQHITEQSVVLRPSCFTGDHYELPYTWVLSNAVLCSHSTELISFSVCQINPDHLMLFLNHLLTSLVHCKFDFFSSAISVDIQYVTSFSLITTYLNFEFISISNTYTRLINYQQSLYCSPYLFSVCFDQSTTSWTSVFPTNLIAKIFPPFWKYSQCFNACSLRFCLRNFHTKLHRQRAPGREFCLNKS